jgi:hypothetical protein
MSTPPLALSAEISVVIDAFHCLAATMNSNYSLPPEYSWGPCIAVTMSIDPGAVSSPEITVETGGGITIQVPPTGGATAALTFMLDDPNNTIVGAYFYTNDQTPVTGGILPNITVEQLPDNVSKLSISNALLEDSNGNTYNYVLVIQNGRNGSDTPGSMFSIGIIDPMITVTSEEP